MKHEGFTPGQWTLTRSERGHNIEAGPCILAHVHGANDGSTANARLIADAPRLAEENERLREALRLFTNTDLPAAMREIARAALAGRDTKG